jgi:transaldolase
MQGLLDLKQSVWLDDLSRDMTRSGELRALIDRGLRGVTTNPTIFELAIERSDGYDDDLRKWSMSPDTDRDVYEFLAIQDVREAADLFRHLYDATGGRDGFVSLEVSPAVARDTQGSTREARRLWRAGLSCNERTHIHGFISKTIERDHAPRLDQRHDAP